MFGSVDHVSSFHDAATDATLAVLARFDFCDAGVDAAADLDVDVDVDVDAGVEVDVDADVAGRVAGFR